MSFKMTYKQIQRDMEFGMAMKKLMGTPVDYTIGKQLRKLNKAFSVVRSRIESDYKRDFLAVHAKFDADGKMVTKPEDENQFVLADNLTEADVEKASIDFWNRETTVDGPKIRLDMVKEIKFTAVELCALEPICSELELAETPVESQPMSLPDSVS